MGEALAARGTLRRVGEQLARVLTDLIAIDGYANLAPVQVVRPGGRASFLCFRPANGEVSLWLGWRGGWQ